MRRSPTFVARARERSTGAPWPSSTAPDAPPGRTEAFARETVAPRELQWPESLRRQRRHVDATCA